MDNNTGDWNTGNRNTGNLNTGNWNTGDWNTGNWNTGDWNTGNRNTGNRNTGNRNTGNWNTGDWNTGNMNTGNRNTGNLNTGNLNTGDWNTGNLNTGDWNTGNWNTGNFHVGFFNTLDAEQIYVFNKLCNKKQWDDAFKPDFLYAITTTQWVAESDMTDKEKEGFPSYKKLGGYLRKLNAHDAYRNAYASASDEDKEAVKNLPNFDADIFLEITGIDVREDAVKELTVAEIEKLLGHKVKVVK